MPATIPPMSNLYLLISAWHLPGKVRPEMKMSMQFKEYLKLLKGYSNSPLTLNRITLPFGIISDSDESTTLLVGHVLEDLMSRWKGQDAVDCIDVVAAAYELGHDKAGPFLDQAPYILFRMAKDLGVGQIH